MALLSSGNEAVDEMATLNMQGNIIPASWFQEILKDNGRPFLLAIVILSDIVYWHRPTEVRDQATGHIVGYKKKFNDDKLYKTYKDYAEQFGEPKTAVKSAFDKLEEYGLIEREFRNVKQPSGVIVYNLMFISLNVGKLKEFTYLPVEKDDEGSTCGRIDHKLEQKSPEPAEIQGFRGGPPEKSPTSPSKVGEVMEKTTVPPVEKSPISPNNQGEAEKTTVPPIEKSPTSPGKVGEVIEKTTAPPPAKSGTNTKNTTENNTEIISSSSEEPIRAAFDDEVREIFDSFGIDDKGIGCIVSASGFDLTKCRKAAEVLKHQKTPIENVVGWFIHAVREGYSITEMQQYTPEKQKGSFFSFQQKNDYDFDELRNRIFAN